MSSFALPSASATCASAPPSSGSSPSSHCFVALSSSARVCGAAGEGRRIAGRGAELRAAAAVARAEN